MLMQFCVSPKHDFLFLVFFFLMGVVDLDNRMVFHCSQKVLVVLLKIKLKPRSRTVIRSSTNLTELIKKLRKINWINPINYCVTKR